MIDGIKIECNYLSNKILNNDILNFSLSVNDKTGEVIDATQKCKYKALHFKIVPSKIHKNKLYCNIDGSLHKYFNDGLHNYNDYSFVDICQTVKDLQANFDIIPEQSILQNIEIGLNIELPISAKDFLNMLICMPSRKFTALSIDKVELGKQCKIGDKKYLKIYDKGNQSKKDLKNLLRIELKYKRMKELNTKYNIRTLADLTDHKKIENLYKLIVKAFNDVIIYENNINPENLNEAKQVQFYKYTNQHYWLNSKNYTQRNRDKKQYEAFFNKYAPQTIKKKILYSIVDKWQDLMKHKNRNCIDFPQDKKHHKKTGLYRIPTLEYRWDFLHNYPEFENLKTDKKKHPVCVVCKTDISDKKSGSKYCSKKCRNKISNKKRTQKNKNRIKKEIENLNKLKQILPDNDFYLKIYKKQIDKKDLKVNRKKQSKIKKGKKLKLQKIVKVQIFINRKPKTFTTRRAKELIKIILQLNKRTE